MDTPSTSASVEMTSMPSYTPDYKQKQPMEVHLEIHTETPSMPPEQRASTSQQPSPNLPCGDLLGDKEAYRSICVPLYNAAVKGNWKASEKIIEKKPGVVRCSITENHETALHIASSGKSTKLMEDFVTKLVSKMKPEDVQLQNNNYNTALCLAAARGNVKIAEILVNYNESLPDIAGSQGMMPLYMASLYRRRDMVNYLYGKSNMMDGVLWPHQMCVWVLLRCVEADFFDIALKIVRHKPELSRSWEVLGALARKTDAFREIKPHFIRRIIKKIIPVTFGLDEKENHAMQLLRFIWTYIMENVDKSGVNDIIRGPADLETQTYSSRVLFVAAEMGNARFIVELIRQYPDLIWKVNDRNQSIFHVAVAHRQEDVYNLMHEIGSVKDFIAPKRDVDGNSMLHLAAKGAKKKRLQDTSGVALQMQRELLWYKEVEGTLPPLHQEKKNNHGLLPHELFTNEHKDLLSASEKWMKHTASHCMVVAALIATVVFPTAFTVPGGYNDTGGYNVTGGHNVTRGYNDKNGVPILRNNIFFIFFVVLNGISLTFATISILMFLYILTSRYAEQDFLESLPKKLMGGLLALFLSITAMMFSYSISFFALYDHKMFILIPASFTALALVPVILYVKLQYGLLADVYHSTSNSKNLFKPKKPMLY